MENETLDDLQNGYFLYQDTEEFRFGIDAVLLSGFVKIKKGENVCDLGTGNGIIPHLLAARYPQTRFTGLEISIRSVDLAQKSIAYNRLSDRISIVCGDIKEADSIFGKESFRVVVSNPPYMQKGSGKAAGNGARAAARHELLCDIFDVARAAGRLLVSTGRFYLVHRPGRLSEIMAALAENHLAVKTLQMVHPFATKEANMVLIEALKGGRPGMKVLPPLIVYDKDGNYTEDVKRIYGMV